MPAGRLSGAVLANIAIIGLLTGLADADRIPEPLEPNNVVGTWEAFMRVNYSSCRGVDVGDRRQVIWKVDYQNRAYRVKVTRGAKRHGVRQYLGRVQRALPPRLVLGARTGIENVGIELTAKELGHLEGRRVVARMQPGGKPCAIVFDVEAIGPKFRSAGKTDPDEAPVPEIYWSSEDGSKSLSVRVLPTRSDAVKATEISSTIRSKFFRKIFDCHDRSSSKRAHAYQGVLLLTLSRSGFVKRALAKGDERDVNRCLRRQARNWRFATKSRKEVELEIPMEFAAGPAVKSRVKYDVYDIGADTTLEARAVAERIRDDYLPGIKRCHRRMLIQNSEGGGKMVIRFTVGPSGRVTRSQAKGFSRSLNTCTESLTKYWRFSIPNDKGGQPGEAKFQIVLLLKPEKT